MSDPLTTDDRERLVAELCAFAGEERASVEDGVARAEMGNTHAELSLEGSVRTGMSLRGFEADDGELRFDHERGRLHVRAGDVEYTVRRP